MRRVYYLIPYEKRLGKQFASTYNFLQKSQYWDKTQHEEYQMHQLDKLLNHVYKNVPYYKRIFNERGLKPNNIQNLMI